MPLAQELALPPGLKHLLFVLDFDWDLERGNDRHEFDFPPIRGGSVKELSGKDGTRVGTIFPPEAPATRSGGRLGVDGGPFFSVESSESAPRRALA